MLKVRNASFIMNSRLNLPKNTKIVIGRITPSGTVALTRADSFEVEGKPVRKKRKTIFIPETSKQNKKGLQIKLCDKFKQSEKPQSVNQFDVNGESECNILVVDLVENDIPTLEEDEIVCFSNDMIQEAVETVESETVDSDLIAEKDPNETRYETRIITIVDVEQTETELNLETSNCNPLKEERTVESVTCKMLDWVVDHAPFTNHIVQPEPRENHNHGIVKNIPLCKVKSASTFTNRKLRSMLPNDTSAPPWPNKKVQARTPMPTDWLNNVAPFFETPEWRTLMEIGWFYCLSSYNLQLLRIYRQISVLLPIMSVIVESDFSLRLNVIGRDIESHEELKIPEKVRDYNSLFLLLKDINRLNVCRGNREPDIVEYLQDRKRGFYSVVTKSQYDENCVKLTSKKICPACFKLRNSVFSIVTRRKKYKNKKLKSLTKEELVEKVKALRQSEQALKRKFQWGKDNKKKAQLKNGPAYKKSGRSDNKNDKSNNKDDKSDKKDDKSDKKNDESDKKNDESDKKNDKSDKKDDESDKKNDESKKLNDKFNKKDSKSDKNDNISDNNNEELIISIEEEDVDIEEEYVDIEEEDDDIEEDDDDIEEEDDEYEPEDDECEQEDDECEQEDDEC